MIAPETPAPRIAARARSLTKVYGQDDARVVALDHVDVDFVGGRFTAVMGPSGSGKSTLMHCVAGLDRPTSGDVLIGETIISTLRDAKLTALRRDRIGFIFQAFNLVPTLTARENIELPMAIAGRKPDRDWFDQVITAVGLADRLTHKPSQLSGGQQQRVACARALLSRPDIIFADEPTGNLDSRSSAEVLAFLARSVVDLGQTIVMVTHDPVVAAHADRALFLADGRLVGDLSDPTRESVLDHMTRLYPDDEIADADTTEIPVIREPVKATISQAAQPATAAKTTGRRAPAPVKAESWRTPAGGAKVFRPATRPGGARSGIRAPAAQGAAARGSAGRADSGAPAGRPAEHPRSAPPAPSRPPAAPTPAPAVPSLRPVVRIPAASPSAVPSAPAARTSAPVPPATRRATSPMPAARPVPHPAKPSQTLPTSPDTARPVVRHEPVVPRSAPAVPVNGAASSRPASVGTAPTGFVSTTRPAGSASRTEPASGVNGTVRSAAALNGGGAQGDRRINGAGSINGVGPTRGGTNGSVVNGAVVNGTGVNGVGVNSTTVPGAGRPRFQNPFAPMTGPGAPSTSRPKPVPAAGAATAPVNGSAAAPAQRPGAVPPSSSEAVLGRRPVNGNVNGALRPDGIGGSTVARSNPFASGSNPFAAGTGAFARPGPSTAGSAAPGPAAPRPFGAVDPLTRHAAVGAPGASGPGMNCSTPGAAGPGGRAVGAPTTAGSTGARGSSSAAPTVNGRSRTTEPTRAPGGSGTGLRPIVPAPMPAAGARIVVNGHHAGTGTPFPGASASAPAAPARGSGDGSAHRQDAPAPGRATPLRRDDPAVPPPLQAVPPVAPVFPPHVPPTSPLVPPLSTPAAHSGAPSASSIRRIEPFPPPGVPGAPPAPPTRGPAPTMWSEPDEPAPNHATAIPAQPPAIPAGDGTDTEAEQVYDAPVQLPRTLPPRSMSDERPARYRPTRRA